MAEWIGKDRKARRCYGFDEIALVPGEVTINPDEVDTGWEINGKRYEVPILASAMDGVVDPRFAREMGRLGGVAVLNLEGIQTRYEDPNEILQEIVSASQDEATKILQKVYQGPIQEKLIPRRIQEIKDKGRSAVVSAIPQRAERFGQIAQESGADIFVVQSTVTTVRHISKAYQSVDFYKFFKKMNIPVIIGNCVTYKVALDLMDAGPGALLIGVGPGSACTSRGVLGLGVPQVTAICDTAAAREYFFKRRRKYIPIIADGGMMTGGDICKAFACGADAVMIGSAFARAQEAPGQGYHWGMAMPHASLPRGTRIQVGVTGTLEEILFGPARLDDGTQNLMGALRTCMGNVGARNVRELQMTELIIAPAIRTEGKVFQTAQRVGMGK